VCTLLLPYEIQFALSVLVHHSQKEPKLARARQIPEWEQYDGEIARFTRRLADEGRSVRLPLPEETTQGRVASDNEGEGMSREPIRDEL